MEAKNQKFKYLYCVINAGLLLLTLWCLIRAADKTGDTYMALLASCGAFAAFNGYWSINPRLYSWFQRNIECDSTDEEADYNTDHVDDSTGCNEAKLPMNGDKSKSTSKIKRRSNNMWLVLLISGTAILVLCTVWFFFMREGGSTSISSAISDVPSMRLCV